MEVAWTWTVLYLFLYKTMVDEQYRKLLPMKCTLIPIYWQNEERWSKIVLDTYQDIF